MSENDDIEVGIVQGRVTYVADVVYGRKTGNKLWVRGESLEYYDRLETQILELGRKANPGQRVGDVGTTRVHNLRWDNPYPNQEETDMSTPIYTQEYPNQGETDMSNAYTLATKAVREELGRRAREAAAEAVEKNLAGITKMVRKAKVGDVIRVHRIGQRPDIMVFSKGTDEQWYDTTQHAGRSDETLIEHCVGSIAEGGKVERMVVAK